MHSSVREQARVLFVAPLVACMTHPRRSSSGIASFRTRVHRYFSTARHSAGLCSGTARATVAITPPA